ncbi:MAG: hypothetical protein AAFX02_08215 [Pseudomonadota bacterium]
MFSRDEIFEADMLDESGLALMSYQQSVVEDREEYSRILMMCSEGVWEVASIVPSDEVPAETESE